MISTGLYGAPPRELAQADPEAVQCSPLIPDATLLDEMMPESLSAMTMVVPPGTIERRFALAQALRVLAPGGQMIAMGPKDKGGARIAKELAGFGCAVTEDSKNHWRICRTVRPDQPVGLDEAIVAGDLRFDPALELCTQPGIFSWDRIDEGTQALLGVLEPLSGHGADLGSGLGVLMREVLARNAAVTCLEGVELDGRAIMAARRNVDDERATLHWSDVRDDLPFAELDFVVMNPPFHSGGQDDFALGQMFLRRARALLRKGGLLWMVANRHLPYEADLSNLFSKYEAVTQTGRFKVIRATA